MNKHKPLSGNVARHRRNFIPIQPLLVFVVFSVVIAIIAAGYYQAESIAMKREKQNEITAIAELKESQIQAWITERMADGEFFRKNESFAHLVENLLLDTNDREIRLKISSQLRTIKANHSYQSVFIVDPQHNLLFSLSDDPAPKLRSSEEGFSDTMRHVAMIDFYTNATTNRINLDFVVPIKTQYATRHWGALLVFRVDPRLNLYPLIQKWPTPSKSAETMIYRKENNEFVYLNDLRFLDNSALTLRTTGSGSTSESIISSSLSGLHEGLDYRGIKVVADTRKIKGTPWTMVTKVDKTEVYSELNTRFLIIIICLVFCSLLMFVTLTILWKNGQKQQLKLLEEKEQKLHDTEQQVQTTLLQQEAILQNIPDLAWLKQADGKIITVNPAFEKAFALKSSEIAGKTNADIWPEEIASKYTQEDDWVVKNATQTSTVEDYIDSEGMRKWVETIKTPVFDSNHNVIGTVGIARDITEILERERKRIEAEEKFRYVFENASLGMALIATNGNFLKVNTAFATMLGYTVEELSLLGFRQITYHEDITKSEELFSKFSNSVLGSTLKIEKRYIKKNGDILWTEIATSIIPESLAGSSYYITQVMDITDRKKALDDIKILNLELELRVAERTTELLAYTQELEAFSYSVSHDLGAPLRSIVGFSSALVEDYADTLDTQAQDYLSRICNSVNHMSHLIEDLLSLSMITRREAYFVDVNVSEIAQEIINTMTIKPNIKFDIEQNMIIYGDRGLVRIALENLFSNAVKYTSNEEQPSITFNKFTNQGIAYLRIKDNGVGFDMAYASKLFIPFQRLHSNMEFKGNGIGLALVQRIINKHGGEIRAESKPGEGATFIFRFASSKNPIS